MVENRVMLQQRQRRAEEGKEERGREEGRGVRVSGRVTFFFVCVCVTRFHLVIQFYLILQVSVWRQSVAVQGRR